VILREKSARLSRQREWAIPNFIAQANRKGKMNGAGGLSGEESEQELYSAICLRKPLAGFLHVGESLKRETRNGFPGGTFTGGSSPSVPFRTNPGRIKEISSRRKEGEKIKQHRRALGRGKREGLRVALTKYVQAGT